MLYKIINSLILTNFNRHYNNVIGNNNNNNIMSYKRENYFIKFKDVGRKKWCSFYNRFLQFSCMENFLNKQVMLF